MGSVVQGCGKKLPTRVKYRIENFREDGRTAFLHYADCVCNPEQTHPVIAYYYHYGYQERDPLCGYYQAGKDLRREFLREIASGRAIEIPRERTQDEENASAKRGGPVGIGDWTRKACKPHDFDNSYAIQLIAKLQAHFKRKAQEAERADRTAMESGRKAANFRRVRSKILR